MLKLCRATLAVILLATAPHGTGSALAQGAPAAPPPPPLCQIRASVFDSYGPFQSAAPAARAAAGHVAPTSAAQSDFVRLDGALAAALAKVPANSEATLALVDMERVIDTADRCSEKAGWGPMMAGARRALSAAFKRNRATLANPDYASRLLRSKTAQAVLTDAGQGAVVARAPDLAAQNAAKEAEGRAEAAANLAANRAAAADYAAAQRNIWRTNASAPAAGSNFCDNGNAPDMTGRPKDSAWLARIDGEALAGCKRVSDRRDGPYFSGLALGTDVTDEQLAHAMGRAYLCFSNSNRRKQLEAAARLARDSLSIFGGEVAGFGVSPSWSEGRNARGNRVVTIECQVKFNLLGFDMSQMAREFSGNMGLVRHQFMQFELAGTRLLTVRQGGWIDNAESSKTDEDFITGSRSTTTICNASQGWAPDVAQGWRRNGGWQIAQTLPHRHAARGGRTGTGTWTVLKRGTLTADIWNAAYDAPVLGQNGNCFGGVVEHFVTLTANRGAFIKAGTSPVF